MSKKFTSLLSKTATKPTTATKTKNVLVLSLFVFIGTTPTSYAFEQDLVAGKTLLAKGLVKAITPNTNESRKLKRRSTILSSDQIITGKNSKAQFRMVDGGMITLKENTEINVSNYIFDNNTQTGSATLEVLSGGLRSISGLIKKTGGDYQVKTPVGSIGIRGTHFDVQVEGDNVFFGVYSGNIDIKLNTNETLSLGVTEGFAFASINNAGQITEFTQAPAALSQSFTPTTQASSNASDSEPSQTSIDNAQSASKNSNNNDSAPESSVAATSDSTTSVTASLVSEGIVESATTDNTPIALNDTSTETSQPDIVLDTTLNVESVYIESQWQGISGAPISELIAERTGTYNFEQLTESNVTSSAGNPSALSLNLAINFDNGTIPGGSLSLTDAQGEWFSTYSGIINIDQLELGINFASHANQRAEGDISAAFSDGVDEITGSFNLNEINNPSVNAQGNFTLR